MPGVQHKNMFGNTSGNRVFPPHFLPLQAEFQVPTAIVLDIMKAVFITTTMIVKIRALLPSEDFTGSGHDQ